MSCKWRPDDKLMDLSLRHIVLTIILLTFCTACDYYDDRLRIVNRTPEAICFNYETDTILTIPSTNKKEYFLGTTIKSGDSQNVLIPGAKRQWLHEIQNCEDSTLSIFVFSMTM